MIANNIATEIRGQKLQGPSKANLKGMPTFFKHKSMDLIIFGNTKYLIQEKLMEFAYLDQ